MARPVKKRILVVDNRATLANGLCELLRESGHDAEAAHSGEAAVKAALATHPDVIVLDLSMPQMDGFETIAAIKALPDAPQATFIAHTAHNDPKTIARVWAAGFHHHLTKPTTIEKFEEILSR